jgi:hypothetical protein
MGHAGDRVAGRRVKERWEEGRWAAHCCWAIGVVGLRARKERREGEKRGVWRVLCFFL